MIPRFCIQSRITDREATPCSVEHLLEIMSSTEIQDICDRIKLLDQEYPNGGTERDEELARLKKQLPVITPHAQKFINNERKNSQAIPSGLVMLDIDHVENPSLATLHLDAASCQQNRIYYVGITPSGHGLRVIAERLPQETIPGGQSRLAALFCLQSYDATTKDLARASFLVPTSYILFLEKTGLCFPDQTTADQVAQNFVNCQAMSSPSIPSSPMRQPSSDDAQISASIPSDYKGINYSDIVDQLIAVLGGTPVQGERNTFYFSLVRYIRYITDFNPDFIFSVLPSFDLSEEERRGEISRANATPRRSTIPDQLTRAIALAEAQMEADSESNSEAVLQQSGLTSDSAAVTLPKLPRVLDIMCRHLPEAFRPAMIIAALPVLGTLATRVRFHYLDHAVHSFSFFSMITAPAATGKSFIRTPVNLLLTPINERDDEERAKQLAYDEERRKCKNRQKQPEDPHACPRNNGVSISIAKLLQLMTYAEGKHLIGIGEEIDTLLKSENAGAWSKKGDIYRLAFDNASYSQMYMSDNSFSTKVDVFYNLLITGTPNGMYRFFHDVEDGLVTRVAFASLPDMRYTRMPEFTPYARREQEQIIATARYLDEQQGYLHCPAVNKAIDQWLEQKRIAADLAQSTAMDTLRRRSAVIGFRAGYLATLLFSEYSGLGQRSNITGIIARRSADFALWVAEYVFQNQMQLFGDKFEAVAEQQDSSLYRQKGAVRSLLSQLPVNFERKDLINLRARNHQSTEVKVVLSRWIKAGYIIRNDDGSYHKIAANIA